MLGRQACGPDHSLEMSKAQEMLGSRQAGQAAGRRLVPAWVSARIEYEFRQSHPRPRFSPGLRGHPELTFGGVRNGLPTGNGRHSSNRRHVTLVTAIVTDRYTGCSLSAVVTAVTSVTAVTLASLAVTVGARFR